MTDRTDPPYCECGSCDSTGRNGGPGVVLPLDAWKVAGHGNLDHLAVAPGHEVHWPAAAHVHHDGWVEILPWAV